MKEKLALIAIALAGICFAGIFLFWVSFIHWSIAVAFGCILTIGISAAILGED